MEVPSESFHWSSWDSRTCYPRRAFNQQITDERRGITVLDPMSSLSLTLFRLYGQGWLENKKRVNCQPLNRKRNKGKRQPFTQYISRLWIIRKPADTCEREAWLDHWILLCCRWAIEDRFRSWTDSGQQSKNSWSTLCGQASVKGLLPPPFSRPMGYVVNGGEGRLEVGGSKP